MNRLGRWRCVMTVLAVATRPSGHSLPHRRVTGVLLDVTARRSAEMQAEQQRHELEDLAETELAVWHEELLWVSYYSSHEGKTSVYLAKVRL